MCDKLMFLGHLLRDWLVYRSGQWRFQKSCKLHFALKMVFFFFFTVQHIFSHINLNYKYNLQNEKINRYINNSEKKKMKTKYITHKGPQSTWNIFRHKQWIWLYPLATKTQQMLYSVSELVPAGYHFRMTEMEAHDALKSKLHNVCHTVYAKSSMSLTQMR